MRLKNMDQNYHQIEATVEVASDWFAAFVVCSNLYLEVYKLVFVSVS